MSNERQQHFNENRDVIKSACQELNIKTHDGCYIATMVYGSYEDPEVKVLRKFRDKVLLKSLPGILFVKLYYKFSPGFVEKTKNIRTVHVLLRKFLNPIIKLLRHL